MKLLGVLAALAVCVARVTPALACGATAPPYYVVDQQWPKDDPAPRNAPIVVTLKIGEDGPVYDEITPSLVLTKAGDDRPITVEARGLAPRLSWVPAEPLDANTAYEAHYNPGYEGHPDSVWEFTTNDSLRPAVALEGKLQASFEAGTDPVLDCRNNCGGDCVEKGTIPVTKARIKLPRVVSGYEIHQGELWLTDNTPYAFPTANSAPTTEGHVLALVTSVRFDGEGKPSADALVTLPEENEPYRPCFAFRVTDARGDQALVEPFCAEEPVPFALSPGNSSFACSFRPAAPHNAGSLVAVIGFFGLGALLRRRFAGHGARENARRG